MATKWAAVERWRLLYKGRWREREHTNVQETRVAVGLVRHLVRSRRNWGSRVLIFIDSMVGLGALAKGRSSSPPLLRLCRQMAAVALAYEMIVMYRYIPSELNPADGPSRDEDVGAADETKLAHADRAAPVVGSPDDLVRLWKMGRDAPGFAGG